MIHFLHARRTIMELNSFASPQCELLTRRHVQTRLTSVPPSPTSAPRIGDVPDQVDGLEEGLEGGLLRRGLQAVLAVRRNVHVPEYVQLPSIRGVSLE